MRSFGASLMTTHPLRPPPPLSRSLSPPMATKLSFAFSIGAPLIFFVSLLVLLFTFDLRPRLFSFSLPISPTAQCSSSSPAPLRVFVYDLPRRFNLGMLDSSYGGDGGSRFPAWPAGTGIKRQHSVEYWMMASLVGGDGREEDRAEAEAVRVLDEEEADVFFVPFFSSLSFNVHGHNMTDPDTEIDRQLQVDVLDILWKSKYWKRSAGRDHVIPLHHPNAFRFLRDLVNASILIVADFARYPRDVSFLNKDVVAPYVHVVDSFTDDDSPDPFNSRPTLLFFRGRTVRKDEGKIRSHLAKMLQGYNDVHFEDSFATGHGIQASTEGMRMSKFCLNPAGDTPSSCRLFDAIVSHCVPVIISDRIELPFENEIDYTEFALFVSSEEALQPNYLITQLRQFPKERWIQMWEKLKNVSHHFEFQHPAKRGDAVNLIWRQVRNKLPAVNLEVHRSRRLKIPDWW